MKVISLLIQCVISQQECLEITSLFLLYLYFQYNTIQYTSPTQVVVNTSLKGSAKCKCGKITFRLKGSARPKCGKYHSALLFVFMCQYSLKSMKMKPNPGSGWVCCSSAPACLTQLLGYMVSPSENPSGKENR